jgi:hypothetical protein
MTRREADVLAFIRERLGTVGVAPTLEQIAARFGFSKPRASIIISNVVEEGLLLREHRGTDGLRLAEHRVDLTLVPTEQLRGELARRGVTLDALEEPTPLFNDGRACAANHCTNPVRRGHLMCRHHWFRLPVAYRNDMMNAWASRQVQAFSEALERARNYLGGYTNVLERVG